MSSALYPRLLDSDWPKLDPAVRGTHLSDAVSPLRLCGLFTISHGKSRLARAVARLLRLPPPGWAVPTRLIVRREPDGEHWQRSFGRHRLATFQRPLQDGLLGEQFGPLEFRTRLEVEQEGLVYRQVGVRLRLGPLIVPLPLRFSPRVDGREEPAGAPHRTRVTVRVDIPIVGRLIGYVGDVEREEEV